MTVPTLLTVERPRAHGYGALLDDLLVRLAVGPDRPLVTETAQLQPNRVDTSQTPEDFRPDFGDIHSQDSWTGGEGLLDRFRRNPADHDPVRFWDSKGVNVSPTEQGRPQQLRLMRTVEQVDAISGTVRLAAHGDTVWATSGQSIRKTTDITASTPTFADDDPHDSETATDVADLATLGTTVYAALGANGVHRDEGSGWSHHSDVEAVRVWSVLDRIVASDGSKLWEVAAGTGSVELYTLAAGEQWVEVVDAAGAMVAAATNGFLYVFDLDENDTLTVASQTRLKGETPRAMAARADRLWVAASSGDELRLWSTRVTEQTVGDLQLVREWQATNVGSMAATRDRVYLGVNEVGGDTHLWQVELTTFGIFRSLEVGEGNVTSVLNVDDMLVVGVANEGVKRETDQLEERGWLIGPMSDFFRAEAKSWVTGWADVTVPFEATVELWFTTSREAMFDEQHPDWTLLQTFWEDSEASEYPMSDVFARSLAAKVVLKPNVSNQGPTVQSVAFRAYPGPGDVVARLPVDVGDQVERFGRRPVQAPGRGRELLDALHAKEGRTVICHLYATGDTVRGVVERVSTPVPALTPRGSQTQVSTVTVRGRRLPKTGLPLGGDEVVDAPVTNQRTHIFTSDGFFETGGITNVRVLVVAGGGGGGKYAGHTTGRGGGGGGGGYRDVSGLTVTAGTAIAVKVGAGGLRGGRPSPIPGVITPGGLVSEPGEPSAFGDIVAEGGGWGGNFDDAGFQRVWGGPGGSGGGASSMSGAGPGAGIEGQGNDGGEREEGPAEDPEAGGGGGAGGPGETGAAGPARGTSFPGLPISHSAGGAPSSGVGETEAPGEDGRGGGGGAAADGGSGVVIVSYSLDQLDD